MKIQSLSVVVPNKNCINNCPFCVSKMHTEDYRNQLDHNLPFFDLYIKDYRKRMEFARDNGCNTVMLTGDSEPQQNRQFLMMFGLVNQGLERPFRNIEMQTTGTLLDEGYLRFLRNHVGVNLISLSLSAFNSETNAKIIGMRQPTDIVKLCELIKKYDFTLRLSINLIDTFRTYLTDPGMLFQYMHDVLKADQITFRVMYATGNSSQSIWLKEHALPDDALDLVSRYIAHEGRYLETLEYGASRYSVNDMSIVIDKDCMSTEPKETLKYLILREDCKLYSKWDDKASIIF